MDPMRNSHIKLLAFDLLSLTQKSSSSSSSMDHVFFFRNGRPVYRAETLGVVVSRDEKSDKFLKFLIDDGTGCVPCILWLNHFEFYSRRNPSDVRLMADMAKDHASQIQLGVLARIRGRITPYKGMIQITVSDVVIERDPNSEILHWLECVKLAKKCYDCKSPPFSSSLQKQNR